MRTIIAIALLAAVLSGCAGTQFSYDKARTVEVGMSEYEVLHIMGRPYSVVTRGDEQMWVWSHATAWGGARAVSFKMKDGKVIETPSIPQSFK